MGLVDTVKKGNVNDVKKELDKKNIFFKIKPSTKADAIEAAIVNISDESNMKNIIDLILDSCSFYKQYKIFKKLFEKKNEKVKQFMINNPSYLKHFVLCCIGQAKYETLRNSWDDAYKDPLLKDNMYKELIEFAKTLLRIVRTYEQSSEEERYVQVNNFARNNNTKIYEFLITKFSPQSDSLKIELDFGRSRKKRSRSRRRYRLSRK